MVATSTLIGRPLTVTTVLDGDRIPGKSKFAARRLQVDEAMSQLFRGVLDVITDRNISFAFDQLLGTPMLLELASSTGTGTRYFHGICRRIVQSGSDADNHHFRFELAPQAWLLTKRTQCRIFQQISVPDILRKVFTGLEPAPAYELPPFEARDYCVQYRETDWNFAARLMEEEGIYYFFRHSNKGHQLVLANSQESHKEVPFAPKIALKSVTSAGQVEDYISYFDKAQEITCGKTLLWDHNFELPHKHLEAEQQIQESLNVGLAKHKLRFGQNGKLEAYDYPGDFAERFDGIGPGGVERPADLQKLFDDNKRTAGIRMEQEAVRAIECRGNSNCRQLTPGFKFTLNTQSGDALARGLQADGTYIVTSVNHSATVPDASRSGNGELVRYSNSFTAIPLGLPFRPLRLTPKPIVPGSQTAVVTGPNGEEIFTDKYGRVKVQFHWDREGKYDASSSCWLRVGTHWAGRNWGAVHIPRIGQEVIVDFLEGDPDRPIIVGSVYNADQMPPYKLPDHKTQSGIKSHSSPGGQGFNEMRFEDSKGKEEIFVHAQRNLNTVVEAAESSIVGGSRQTTIFHGEMHVVKEDGRKTVIEKGGESHIVEQDGRMTAIQKGHEELIVNEGNRVTTVDKGNDQHFVRDGHREVQVLNGNDALLVKAGDAYREVPNGVHSLNAKQIWLNGQELITLSVGSSRITIAPDNITIESQAVVCSGSKGVKINGEVIDLN